MTEANLVRLDLKIMKRLNPSAHKDLNGSEKSEPHSNFKDYEKSVHSRNSIHSRKSHASKAKSFGSVNTGRKMLS